MSYRTIDAMRSADLLEVLKAAAGKPLKQIEIFTLLGGDPDDHKYAYLSFLTKQLREAGHNVQSSRRSGVWLEA